MPFCQSYGEKITEKEQSFRQKMLAFEGELWYNNAVRLIKAPTLGTVPLLCHPERRAKLEVEPRRGNALGVGIY